MGPMPRLRLSSLFGLALVCGGLLGCRADDAECVALAEHVVSLSSGEGRPIVGTASAIEEDCKRLRPTRELTQCMIDAQSLAELAAC